MAEKWYPFIKEDAELPKKEKKELWDNIKSMFCYKMGNSVMNHTDNILTSILVSTTTVGLFSNYTMIYMKISSFINIIFGSITASVGNLNVTSTATEKYRIYKVLELMSYFLFAVACIGIWFIADEVVIAMSATTEYLLDRSILVVIIINYYIMGLLNPNCVFRQTSGLFKVAKYSMVVCCILNIVFSIIFGKIWGLFGIILGSIVSRLLTNVWYEPYVLYKKFFDKNPMEYYIREGLRILIVLAIIMLLTPLINLVDFYNLYLRIGVKFIICLTIPTMILILINWRSEEFQYLLDKVKFVFKSYKDKLKNLSRIQIVACGTSLHAAMVGKYLIEDFCGIPVDVEPSSEYIYRKTITDKNTLVIGVSQSGETADTITAVRQAKNKGSHILIVTNRPDSTMAREADSLVPVNAGIEVSVAATKSYMAQLISFYLLAIYMAEVKNSMPKEELVNLKR